MPPQPRKRDMTLAIVTATPLEAAGPRR